MDPIWMRKPTIGSFFFPLSLLNVIVFLCKVEKINLSPLGRKSRKRTSDSWESSGYIRLQLDPLMALKVNRSMKQCRRLDVRGLRREIGKRLYRVRLAIFVQSQLARKSFNSMQISVWNNNKTWRCLNKNRAYKIKVEWCWHEEPMKRCECLFCLLDSGHLSAKLTQINCSALL